MRRLGGGCEPRANQHRPGRVERLSKARRQGSRRRLTSAAVRRAARHDGAARVGASAAHAGAEAGAHGAPAGDRGCSHVRAEPRQRRRPGTEAMTRGMLARTPRPRGSENVTAPRYPALRIGPARDANEQEADRVADEAMTAGVASRHWSLSTTHVAAPRLAPPIV